MFQTPVLFLKSLWQKSPILGIYVLVLCLILFAVLCYLFTIFLKNRIKLHKLKIIRQQFQQQYKIDALPTSITVIRNKTPAKFCYYELNYPHWAYPKSDGTRDGRYRNNYIIWEQSNLYLDGYTVTSLRPYDLLFIVQVLREQGVPIRRTVEEKEKLYQIQKKERLRFAQVTASSIARQYADNPTDFENFCALLLSKIGFSTVVTAKTRDGGFDIYLKKGAETGIAECKCYSSNHSIGRPAIQKLVGANQIEHTDIMYFITTSTFSADAVAYAHQTGVVLIDGINLAALSNQYFASSSKAIKSDEEILIESEFTIEDMRSHVPKDIFTLYFNSFIS